MRNMAGGGGHRGDVLRGGDERRGAAGDGRSRTGRSSRGSRRSSAQMTLEEKVGQLTQVAGAALPGAEARGGRSARAGPARSSGSTTRSSSTRCRRSPSRRSRLEDPACSSRLDVIHGYRTIFPVPLAMAASWDPARRRAGAGGGRAEARAAGLHWTFAPDARHRPRRALGPHRRRRGRGSVPRRGHGGGPGARLPGRRTSARPTASLACAKHFAGYGAADGGRDYDPVYLPEGLLRNVYLPPFQAAVKAGVGTFMSAYMDLNDVPASGNRFLLRDVLRGEWGFKGFVVSDAFAVGNLVTQGFARDGARRGPARARAPGSTWTWPAAPTRSTSPGWSRTARCTMARDRRRRCGRILAIKVRMGLFEQPYADESQLAAGARRARAPRRGAAAPRSARWCCCATRGRLLPLAKT